MEVSVIIPIYNSEKYLSEALSSVVNQSFKDIEIICVDDCSTDNSAEIVENFIKNDSRIKFLKLEKNSRQGIARNEALKIATGKYIMFMDSDDILDQNAILDFYNAIENNDCDLVVSHIENFIDGGGETEFVKSLSKFYEKIKHKQGIVEVKTINGFRSGPVAKLFKKEIIDKYNIKFSENIIHEDELFHWSYLSVSNKLYFLETSYYKRRMHSDCTMTNSKGEIKLKAYIQLLEEIYEFLKKNNLYETLMQQFESFFQELRWVMVQGAENKTFKKRCKKEFSKLEDKLFFTKIERIFSLKDYNCNKYKMLNIFGLKFKFKKRENKVDKINIGVVGCGVIGGALIDWVERNNPNVNVLKVDPPKGLNDDLSTADVIFISIHIPTEPDGTQDLKLLEQIVSNAPNVPIFIRTTLLPGTCKMLSEKYNKDVNFMPEFLTERTAVADFNYQPVIFSNHFELLKKIFVGKEYLEMTTLEAEITKYAHNVFGALKVTYFNGINELCQKLGANYDVIQKGCLLSGYINKPHTDVPGPDGKFGYGGKCFPKDVNAFIDFLDGTQLQKIISLLPEINDSYRK